MVAVQLLVPSGVSPGSGNRTFTVTVQPNNLPDIREATLTVSSSGITRTINIKQDAKSEPSLDVRVDGTWIFDDISPVSPVGGKKEVQIISNINWMVTSNAAWLTVPSDATSGSGNRTFSITIQPNNLPEQRSAILTVSGAGLKQTINIKQDALTGALEVSINNTSSLPVSGGTREITITSNLSWTATSNATWLTVPNDAKQGTGNKTFTVTIQPTTLSYPREATLTVSGPGITRTINIRQDEAIVPYVYASMTDNSEVPATGVTREIRIESNIGWTLTCDAPWITVPPNATSGTGDYTFTVTVQPSTSTNVRTGILTVRGTVAGGLTSEVFINQKAAGTTDPGTTAAPSVTLLQPENVTKNSTTLKAQINPNGLKTSYFFQYSKVSSFVDNSLITKTTEVNIIDAGNNYVPVSAPITNLDSDIPYYFRIVAHNTKGTFDDKTKYSQFRTSGGEVDIRMAGNLTLPSEVTLNKEYSFTVKVLNNNSTTQWNGSFYLKEGETKETEKDVTDWQNVALGRLYDAKDDLNTRTYKWTTTGKKTLTLYYQTNSTGSGTPVTPNGYSNPITIQVVAPIYHTVTFNSNGGSSVDPQQILAGSTAKRPSDPKRQGYTFADWYYDGAVWNFSTPITKPIILTAQWTQTSTPIPVQKVTINGLQSLKVNESARFSATIDPAGATNRKVTWTTSNSAIASLSDATDLTVKVTALKAGTATITVITDDGKKTDKTDLEVKAATVETPDFHMASNITGIPSEVTAGQNRSFNATVKNHSTTKSYQVAFYLKDGKDNVWSLGKFVPIGAGESYTIQTGNTFDVPYRTGQRTWILHYWIKDNPNGGEEVPMQSDYSNRVKVNVNQATTPATAPTIETKTLPDGTVNVDYSAKITVNGSKPISVTFNPTGSWPDPNGFSFDPVYCTITGNPQTAGTYNFTIKAANEANPNNPVTQALSIRVNDKNTPVLKWETESEDHVSLTHNEVSKTITFHAVNLNYKIIPGTKSSDGKWLHISLDGENYTTGTLSGSTGSVYNVVKLYYKADKDPNSNVREGIISVSGNPSTVVQPIQADIRQ
jgi:uncharacterized repeat protein (TIGR02543 family)